MNMTPQGSLANATHDIPQAVREGNWPEERTLHSTVFNTGKWGRVVIDVMPRPPKMAPVINIQRLLMVYHGQWGGELPTVNRRQRE